ncbi:MAG TPA: hypothetical protein VIH42_05420, partial [Thermoguttaceae bacterium]
SRISPVDLLFQGKRIEGFYLGDWVRRRGMIRTLLAANRVQRMIISGRLHTEVARRLRFTDLQQGLLDYCKNMTSGKAILTPWT